MLEDIYETFFDIDRYIDGLVQADSPDLEYLCTLPNEGDLDDEDVLCE